MSNRKSHQSSESIIDESPYAVGRRGRCGRRAGRHGDRTRVRYGREDQ